MIQVASTELKRSLSSSMNPSNPPNELNAHPNSDDTEIGSREPSHFLDCFLSNSIASSILYKHAFHYLLLNDHSSLAESCEAIAHSIESEEDSASLSITDQIRLQLLVLSLCTVSEDGSLSLQPSLLERANPSDWIWTKQERSEVMKRLRSAKKRRSSDADPSENEQQTHKENQNESENVSQAQPRAKRSKRSKQTDEDMIVEYSITLPTVSLKFAANLLSPFLQSRIDSNTQQIDSFLDRMDKETIE